MHSKDKNWIIKQDKLNNSDTLNKLYQTKKIKKDEEKNSSANEKKNYNPKLLINIKDYVKLLNSIESLKKKLQNELEKFDAGLTKINYMNKNYDNYNKIKKDLKKIQTNSNSELDSMNKTNLYFSNFCIEKKSNKEFKSDSESSNNSSFDYLKDKFDKRRSDCHRIECKTSRDNYMSYNYEERGILMDIYKPTNHKR